MSLALLAVIYTLRIGAGGGVIGFCVSEFCCINLFSSQQHSGHSGNLENSSIPSKTTTATKPYNLTLILYAELFKLLTSK